MIHHTEVQKLEEEARELTSKVAEQEREIRRQVDELQLLRCRTPRPAWLQLHEELRDHGVASPTDAAQNQYPQSTSHFAASLANQLMGYAGELEVGLYAERASKLLMFS